VRILHDWFTQQGRAMQDLLAGETPTVSVAAPARSGYN
jgi:hypothetical protein